MTPARLQGNRSVAIGAVLFVLVGCGGGSDGQAPAGVGDAFANRALAVCKKALDEKHAWQAFPAPGFNPTDPDPAKLPVVATWLDGEVAPTFSAWRDDLQALGDPPSGQAAWHDVLTAVSAIAQGNEDQIAAAKAGDTDAFVRATQAMKDAQVDLVTATDAAGVSACADVHAA